MPDTLLNQSGFIPALLTLGIILGIILGVWLGSRVRRASRRRRLERHGFTVLDEPVNQPSCRIVNGEESPFTVRADYLVEAITHTATGAAIGLVLGWAGSFGIRAWTPIAASVPPLAVVALRHE